MKCHLSWYNLFVYKVLQLVVLVVNYFKVKQFDLILHSYLMFTAFATVKVSEI